MSPRPVTQPTAKRILLVGPSGGRYYISASGGKVYVKHEVTRSEKNVEDAKWQLRKQAAERKAQRQDNKSKFDPQDLLPKGHVASPSQVRAAIKKLRSHQNQQEKQRVAEFDDKQKAISDLTTHIQSNKNLSAWSRDDGASVEVKSHPKGGWAVVRWRDQKVDRYDKPDQAARRFVDLVGHQEARKSIKD